MAHGTSKHKKQRSYQKKHSRPKKAKGNLSRSETKRGRRRVSKSTSHPRSKKKKNKVQRSCVNRGNCTYRGKDRNILQQWGQNSYIIVGDSDNYSRWLRIRIDKEGYAHSRQTTSLLLRDYALVCLQLNFPLVPNSHSVQLLATTVNMFVTLYNEQKVLPAHAKRLPLIQFGFYIKDAPGNLYAISQALQSEIGFMRSEERDLEHMNNRYGLIQNVPFVFVFSENSTNNVLHPHYAIFYPENQKNKRRTASLRTTTGSSIKGSLLPL